MKFLLDQNMPIVLAKWLEARGYQAEHVKRLRFHEANDLAIVHHAKRTNAMVITKDADFRRLAAPPPSRAAGRLGAHRRYDNPELFDVWERLWPGILQALLNGESLIEVV